MQRSPREGVDGVRFATKLPLVLNGMWKRKTLGFPPEKPSVYAFQHAQIRLECETRFHTGSHGARMTTIKIVPSEIDSMLESVASTVRHRVRQSQTRSPLPAY